MLRLAWCAAFFFFDPVRGQLLVGYVLLWGIISRAPARLSTTTPGIIDGEVVEGEVLRPYESSYGTAPWRYRDP